MTSDRKLVLNVTGAQAARLEELVDGGGCSHEADLESLAERLERAKVGDLSDIVEELRSLAETMTSNPDDAEILPKIQKARRDADIDARKAIGARAA